MRVLVITGAGISAESGISTFRGKDGYWRNLDPMKLATQEAFQRDTALVWEWYRERRAKIRAALPNFAHQAITRLANEASDFLLVTQNVDDLHRRAEYEGRQLGENAMVQVHGDIFLTRCSRCAHQYRELANDGAELPMCAKCVTLMRPGVVWFGESLDLKQIARVENFLEQGRCDYVLVIGTTALFAYIVDWALRAAAGGGRLIEINPESTALSEFTNEFIRQPAGVALPPLVDQILRK